MPGYLWVEMCEEDAQEGSIALPDNVATKRRRDFARVISIGDEYCGVMCNGVRSHDPSVDLSVGDIVLVDYRFGSWYQGFGELQTRCYGCTGGVGSSEEFQRYSVSEAVPAKWENGMIRAIQDRVILEVQTKDNIDGVLLLREQVEAEATVVNHGSLVTGLNEGDKVVYHVNEAVGFEGVKELEKFVVVPVSAIKAVVNG